MRTTTLLLGALLLLPLAAHADDDHTCKQSQPRNLQLDFRGIDTVVFDVGGSDIDVRASSSPTGKVEGRACASNAKFLEQLTLTQQTSGRTLTVRALRNGRSDAGLNFSGLLGGDRYAYLVLGASVPDSVMVQLKVGSGDARLQGARSASADIGSGDIDVSRIRGAFTAKVGSGDLKANDIGTFDLLSIGSGDATIHRVRGASKVGSVGSGDLEITGSTGAVEIGSVGSGDVNLRDIGGSVSVGSIGSGDIGVDGVRGDLTVRSSGSGDVNHRGVSGRVDVPKKD